MSKVFEKKFVNLHSYKKMVQNKKEKGTKKGEKHNAKEKRADGRTKKSFGNEI